MAFLNGVANSSSGEFKKEMSPVVAFYGHEEGKVPKAYNSFARSRTAGLSQLQIRT